LPVFVGFDGGRVAHHAQPEHGFAVGSLVFFRFFLLDLLAVDFLAIDFLAI